ncbi:MAG: Transglutaminase-like superfamily protein [Bacteroidetes bacterium ADurb.Bin008]|jgi:transglutaminase-like putative cysteine protease|nr:MAG: Transglutaminase-like superfamily protein [Bacteroidetes bacterium ADurb.Bin008]
MVMRKTFFLFLTLLLLGASAWAQPQELIRRAGDAKDYPGSGYLLVYDSTRVDVQETGLSYYVTSTLYKVLTHAGAKELSAVKFDYDPLTAFVRIEKARIIRANGDIEVLGDERVYDYPAPAWGIYWGARQKMVDIGRLEPGDGVEVTTFKKGFSYALLYQEELSDDYYIPPMRGHFYDIVEFYSRVPIKEKVYQVTIDKEKNLQYKFYNGEHVEKVTEMNGKVNYLFSVKNILPFQRELRMVSPSDVAPKLLLSTSPDWYAKSKWFYGVNEDYGSFNSTPEVEKIVKKVLKNAKTEFDSISLLNHWVADEIRYSGLSMGKGEGYTLHNADMNFRDRCGVCKDKAGALITLLRAAGFESYAAMTMAGSRIDRIPADQFNHSVTVVKRKNGEYMLLDPTWVPFLREEWSSREQQQNYLMGLPEGTDLMETPLSPPENHYFRINGTSELSEDGTLTGEFTLTAEGQSDAAVRRLFTGSRRADWEGNIEKELMKISPRIEILSVEKTHPYEYLLQPVKITVKYRIPNYAIATKEEMVFIPVVATNLFGYSHSHTSFDPSLPARKYPFADGCSKLIELNETITLPASMTLAYSPEAKSVSGSGADYESSYLLEGNVLKMHQTVRLKKRIYQPEDWTSFNQAVKYQSEMAKQPVILKY